jgi:hypothetical protein
MKFILQRVNDNGNSTIGNLFYEDGRLFSFTLEDEYREVKVKGETRIPAGFYELKIKKEDTQLTIKHRTNYGSWFKYHIEITNIPNFTGVYVHAGNDERHTEGCLLLGDNLMNNEIFDKNHLAQSTQAVKRFYEKAYPALEAGQKVFLEIRDEKI